MDKDAASRAEELPKRRSEHYRDIYANNCNVAVGAFDATIMFGHVKSGIDGQFQEEVASVTMSHSQFKALAIVLRETVDGFERGLGEIPLPPTFVPKTAEAVYQQIKGQLGQASDSSAPALPSPRSPRARKVRARAP